MCGWLSTTESPMAAPIWSRLKAPAETTRWSASWWTDPVITNICMFDPVGGSVSFYDTHIAWEPV
jgi:hypothetical protein